MIATIGFGIVIVLAFLCGLVSLGSGFGLLRILWDAWTRHHGSADEWGGLQAFVMIVSGLLSWCLFEVVFLVQAVR